MLRREQVIGIVSSWDIRWRESEGYSLLVTESRIVGACLPHDGDEYRVFFPLGIERDPSAAKDAEGKADKIVATKDFELQRDKIVKVIYEEPGVLSGGRLLIGTVGRKVEISITVTSGWNPDILLTTKTLVSSFLVFAPGVFYDEKTGGRVRDDVPLPS